MAYRHGHGNKQSRTYCSWLKMIERTCNVKCDNYPKYGGSGITVCERWKVFDNFLADMGVRPEGTTLDRIDGTGNYEPGNCRWATQKEQHRNKKNNRMLTYRGETRCVGEWAEIFGLCYNTVHNRLSRGCTVDQILAPVTRGPGKKAT